MIRPVIIDYPFGRHERILGARRSQIPATRDETRYCRGHFHVLDMYLAIGIDSVRKDALLHSSLMCAM